MAETNLKTAENPLMQKSNLEQNMTSSITITPRTKRTPTINEDGKKIEIESKEIAPELSETEKVHKEPTLSKSSTTELRQLARVVTRSKRIHVSSDEENGTKVIVSHKSIKKQDMTEPQPGTSSVVQTVRKGKVVDESKTSSEGTEELSDNNWNDFYEVSELDTESISNVDRKTLDPDKVKSTVKTVPNTEDKNVESILGPIRKCLIFKDYNFILTHVDRYILLTDLSKIKSTVGVRMLQSSSAEESEGTVSATDVEDQLQNSPPFDYIRLKKQIQLGGGTVYKTIAEVNKTEYSKTITIADYPSRTPNYLLSIALGIPIYRHDLIVNSCKEDIHVTKMLKYSYYMPSGWSLENGRLIDRISTKKKPLKGFLCIVCLSTSSKFWKTLLTAMGAIVHTISKDISAFGDHISFILADRELSSTIYNQAEQLSIPVVTKNWIVQSLIHGEPRHYLSLAEYIYRFPDDSK